MSKNQGTIQITVPITFVVWVVTTFIVWGHPIGLSSDISQKSVCPSSDTEGSLITQNQAEELVRQWNLAKLQVFSQNPNFQKVRELSTGRLYRDLTDPTKLTGWLSNNRPDNQLIQEEFTSVKCFDLDPKGGQITLEVKIFEKELSSSEDDPFNHSRGDHAQTTYYQVVQTPKGWKIADYQTK
jgi:hypothetical protein